MGWAIVWKGLEDKSNLRGIVKIVFSGRYILIIPNPCVGLCKNRIPLFVYRIMWYGGGSPILKNHHISFISAANWGSHCWTNPKPKHVFGRSMTAIPSTSTWNSVGGSALSTNQWEKGIFVAVTCKTFKFSPKGLTKWRHVSMARTSFCWKQEQPISERICFPKSLKIDWNGYKPTNRLHSSMHHLQYAMSTKKNDFERQTNHNPTGQGSKKRRDVAINLR